MSSENSGPIETRGAFGCDFTRLPWLRHLRLNEWFFFTYMIITGFMILVCFDRVEGALIALLGRCAAIPAIMFVVMKAAQTRKWPWRLLRDFYTPFMMGWLYIETAAINHLVMSHQGEILMNIDFWMFGHHPSLDFYKAVHNRLFSEFMNFSYFSYYFIFVGMPVLFLFRKDAASQLAYQRYMFTTAFVMAPCYLFYVFFPTWGPQYIFEDQFSRDNFPGYLFRYALDSMLAAGERPTGAFPSSHTALSSAILVFLWRWSRPWFWVALPTFTGLWFSTVYISAHFVVDIIAGMPLGIIMGILAHQLQTRWTDPALDASVLPLPDDPLVRNPYPAPGIQRAT